MNWIKVTDRLPPEGRYVIVHLTLTNWKDSLDQKGCLYKIARVELGITEEERQKMKRGEIKDPVFYSTTRSKVHRSADEGFNNERPYCWIEFGPSSWFGQDVDYWREIPRL